MKSLDKTLKNLYISILFWIFCIFFLSFTGFIFHISIQPVFTIISSILSVFLFICISKKDNISNKIIISAILIAVIMFVFFGCLSSYIIDRSYDGRWYHQAGILFLKSGWNPIYDDINKYSKILYDNLIHIDSHTMAWIENYPKFAEIFSANIYTITNIIESGKIINFIFAALTFIYSYITLNNINKNNCLNVSISTLIILNPITLHQNATFLVDGLLYYTFINIAFSVINIEIDKNSKKLHIFSLLLNLILFANIKISAPFYCILIFAIWYIFLRLNNKENIKKIFLPVLSAFILLFTISAINPYITNLIKGRHVLHPIMGKEKIMVIYPNLVPTYMENKHPYHNFLISTFKGIKNFNIFKYNKDLDNQSLGDIFGHVIIISLFLLAFLRFKNKDNKKIFLFLTALIISLILVNPYSWWQRYIPWFWAFPVFICYFSIIENKNKKAAYILIFILLLNITLALIQNINNCCKITKKTNEFFNSIDKNKTVIIYCDVKSYGTQEISYFIKLKEEGIKYKLKNKNEAKGKCLTNMPGDIDATFYTECK